MRRQLEALDRQSNFRCSLGHLLADWLCDDRRRVSRQRDWKARSLHHWSCQASILRWTLETSILHSISTWYRCNESFNNSCLVTLHVKDLVHNMIRSTFMDLKTSKTKTQKNVTSQEMETIKLTGGTRTTQTAYKSCSIPPQ